MWVNLRQNAAQSLLHLLAELLDQLSFKDFFLPFGGQLSGDNRWIKLAELIPWDELEDDYASQFGDFQERCHSWAAFQAACINGSCPGSLSSSGG